MDNFMELRLNDANTGPTRRRRPRRSASREHGNWKHICNPSCVYGLIPAEQTIIPDEHWDLREDSDANIYAAITQLLDSGRLEYFADARVTQTAIRNQFIVFDVPWQLSALRHDIDDVCLEITNRWPASLA